ncbi:alpha/beta fold hydrolase [Melittangium boletus]|uniref:alpha/beta fold hydrolase n=1 Tax=Melittangium boletus TaxID=83453 RepID=UPI003DA64DCC
MSESLVLLHGSANGAYSWGAVLRGLGPTGARVLAPDMLGYGRAPAPSATYDIAEEVAHLRALIDAAEPGAVHLVTHSLGTLYGLHLRRALGARVTRLTLIDPVLVSVLRDSGEQAGFDEMEGQYQHFMRRLAEAPAAAARGFVEHWNGEGSWEAIGERARAVITGLAPRVALEMDQARRDTTPLAWLAESPPPTHILLGERTRVAPQAVTRQLARAFGATVTVVPGAAHMIPLTHAAHVVRALGSPATA